MAFGVGLEDYAHGIQVEDLFERDVLGVHLVPDGVGRLDALLDREPEPGVGERVPDGGYEIVYVLVPGGDVLAYALGNLVVFLGFLELEPDVLHFRLDPVETQPVGQRNEDVHGLGKYLVPLVLGHELYGAAVVQTVRELYQDHPDVVIEGQQDALEVLGLEALGAGRGSFPVLVVQHGLDLGESVHERGYFVAEQAPDVVHRVAGVLHHVVEQGGADGLVAQADFAHHYLGDLYGVQDIGFARAAAHVLVGLVGELEGFLHVVDLFFVAAAAARDFKQRRVCLVDDPVVVLSKF